jgi:hypothetical protein
MRALRKNDPATKRVPRLKLSVSPRLRGVLTGGAFIVVAGILGWSAQELTYSQALQDWERQRLPTDRIWNYALGNRGWTVSQPSPISHQAFKKLPASLDAAGSVWASPDLEWVIVYHDSNHPTPYQLFCRGCRTAPERWDPVGTGWSAFDRIMKQAETTKAKPIQALKRTKKAKFVDSREIQY